MIPLGWRFGKGEGGRIEIRSVFSRAWEQGKGLITPGQGAFFG